MDPSVCDGLLDVMDHRDSFNPLLSEKGSISNLLLLTTLNIIPLASLKKFLVDLTYIWLRFRICMTLSNLIKQTAITRGGGGPLPAPPTPFNAHTPTPLPMHNQMMSYFVPWITVPRITKITFFIKHGSIMFDCLTFN